MNKYIYKSGTYSRAPAYEKTINRGQKPGQQSLEYAQICQKDLYLQFLNNLRKMIQ